MVLFIILKKEKNFRYICFEKEDFIYVFFINLVNIRLFFCYDYVCFCVGDCKYLLKFCFWGFKVRVFLRLFNLIFYLIMYKFIMVIEVCECRDGV